MLSITLLTRPFLAVQFTADRSLQDFNRSNVWLNPAVPMLGAVFFLYVGTEASVGGWIASYAKRSMPGAVSWAIAPAFFWASLLFGRAVSPSVLGRLSQTVLSRAGLTLASLGLVGALIARNPVQLGISTCLVGLGLSPVFPIAIAAVSERFGEAASRVAGLMFNLAGLGGASLPWLVGFTSTRANSLRIGLLIPLFGSILMLILNLLLAPKKQLGLLMTKKGPDNPALKA
jgi:fucose permease